MTLALSLTSYTPLIISPGSSIDSISESITAVIHSSSSLQIVKNLSTSPNAKFISVGSNEEKSDSAQDLLATGLALKSEEKVIAIPEFDPTDLALVMVSDGVSLNFTHLVSVQPLFSLE